MNTNRINNKNIKRFAIAAGTTAGALFLTAGIVAGIGNNGSKNADVAQAPAAPQAAVVVDQPAASPSVVEESAPVAVENVAKVSKPAPVKAPSSSKKSTNRKAGATGGDVVLSVPVVDQPTPAPVAAPSAPETTVAPSVPNTQAPAAQPAEQQQAAAASEPAAAASEPAPSNNSTSTVTIPKWSYTNTFGSKIAAVDLTQTSSTLAPSRLCLPGVTC